MNPIGQAGHSQDHPQANPAENLHRRAKLGRIEYLDDQRRKSKCPQYPRPRHQQTHFGLLINQPITLAWSWATAVNRG